MGWRIALIAPFGLRAKGTTRARLLPLARQLVRLGHAVAVFVPPYDSPEDAGRCWNDAGVEVVNLTLPRGRAVGPLDQLLLGRRLASRVRAWRPDLVHAFKPKGPSGLAAAALWLAAPSRRAAGCRLVVDSDDWEGPGGWNDDPRTGYSPLQKRFFAWQERFGLTHADAWTVTSDCLRRRALAFGAPAARVFVLHNGIERAAGDRAAQTAAGPRIARPPAALLYTRFAGVRPAEALDVWARVRRERPDAQLIVVGRGVGGEERSLVGAPGITVAGWVEPEKLPAVFAEAQTALAPWDDRPTNRARHSAKILELMAAGLPIVAYAVGELPATLGDAGRLAPAGDQAAFARETLALLADETTARRLGAAARARVADHFTWERLATVALAVYARALEN